MFRRDIGIHMKKFLAILMACLLLFSMAGCGNGAENETVNTETGVTGETAGAEEGVGFQVVGKKLLDANGNEFVMRGVNHAHAWYAIQDVTALDAIAETGSNSVRIVCSNGLQYTKDEKETLEALVKYCKEKEMIAILEVHDGTGDRSQETLAGIVDYWIEMKDVFIGNEAYVILNIANEWLGTWDSKAWRDGYTAAIPRLREAGIKNTIMVDCAGWGQYGRCIKDYGMEVFESDPDRNTMFAIHMYGTSGKNEKTIQDNLNAARDQGLCIAVGEFGYTHSDGDVDEEYLMQYCTENGIGYLAWSWKGNSGGVEYLDIAITWDGSSLSDDWGEKLINGTYGIKETSVPCSVFE